MSKGGGGGSTTVEITPEQRAFIAAQTDFFNKTIRPTYEGAVRGATDIYNKNMEGVLAASQNQGRVAAQAQEALGGTGESALRTGISGLQNLFDPNYERNQVMAALAPAQSQYMQNVANQQANFGGAGQLGSARQALADRQLAGQTQAAQMQAAAQIQQQIAGQRAAAANQLAQLGQGGIGQALGAAGNKVSAAMVPQQLYNQYASVIFGTPASSYTPDFRGTQSSSTENSRYGFDLGPAVGAAGAWLFSDQRVKENVQKIRTQNGLPVYRFNYIWDKTPRVGVMAQDLLADRRYASAVKTSDTGYYMVDYSQLPVGVTKE
jgi:hypothetical protein